ncbi:MAG: hypothetical protein WAO83_03070 [Fuerstiella sp.]
MSAWPEASEHVLVTDERISEGFTNVRFRTKERPRGLLKARDQKRLTLLIFGLGVIMICFTVVRRPQFWSGLFPETVPASQAADGSLNSSSAGTAENDANWKVVSPAAQQPAEETSAPDNSIKHDEFLIGEEARSANSADEAVSVTALRPAYQVLAESPDGTTPRFDPKAIPSVPESLLKEIRDDVIGVHSAESDAYFAAMKMASVIAERKLENAPAGAYALFMDSPNGSRGKPWNISGKLRKLSVVKGQVNALGVGTVYDAWLTTADSGENLVHAVSLNADPKLVALIGENNPTRTRDFKIKDAPSVKFTGYFFKREGYESRNGVSMAPLFVASRFREVPKVVVTSTRADQLTPYLGWLAFIVCAAMLLMVWSFSMSDAAHAQTRAHQLTKLPAVGSFEDVTSVTIVETLNQLEMAAQSPTPKLDRH